MFVFVTGGSGFLGKKLIQQLINDGHKVLALARSTASANVVKAIGAQPVSGDLNNIATWSEQIRGVDAVVHCAAPVRFWGDDADFEREITEATMVLHAEAERVGVKRFIFISSESVIFDGKNDVVGIDESHPYAETPVSAYGRAKKKTEQRLLNKVSNVHTIILRPSFIYGDDSPIVNEIIERAKKRSFIWVNHGAAKFEAVHVLNLVQAICLSLENGSKNGIYFVSDEHTRTVKDFLSEIFRNAGVKSPRLSLPHAVADRLASASEFMWKLTGKRGRPWITKAEVDFMSAERSYSLARAKKDLGYRDIVSH